MTVIEEIKRRVRLEDVVSVDVKLTKKGASFSGFCPFHENKDTPSFVVYPNNGEDGIWKCFGQCNESGDVIDYVMKKNTGWDKREAINWLAEKYEIEIHAAKHDLAGRAALATAADVRRVAMGVFRRWLVGEVDRKTKEITRAGDKVALDYALDRGWTLETMRFEGVGFTGNGSVAEFKEMRAEFSMYGIDPLCPTAVMVLGFKGDLEVWAAKYEVDEGGLDLEKTRIYGFMDTPALAFGHKFEGQVEYISNRYLPEWEEKRGRKSHNPMTVLAGAKRAYRNSLYRHRHSSEQDKGALLYVIEGQGDSVTCRQFGVPSVALCGASWNHLVESGEVGDWRNDYEDLIYVTDADAAGEKVVTGKDNNFELSNALGAMLWVGKTPKKEWTRSNGGVKSIKDVNDIAQWMRDTSSSDWGEFNSISMKAERIMVLAARYAGTLSGNPHVAILEKILKPMILSIPADKRGATLERDLALALYPNISKANATSDFNKWLKRQEKVAAEAAKSEEDEDHIREVETVGGYFKNPKDPSEGWVVDMTYDLATQKAMLAYRDDKGEIGTAKQLDIYGVRYYPKVDDFVRKGVVVFPSDLGPLVSTSDLLKIHEGHNRKSILLDKPTDYSMASFYSVFSWVFDCFNELPFLRARGGKDTGKSAIMLRIGYLCYRLAKSTGIGSTASLKHAQELYKCTIFFDEMDIADKFDERIVMLNVRAMKDQANVWSMKAVTDINGDQNYEPQAHNVYGCALITMYGAFSDEATDSRCITFDLFGKDIAELKAKGIPRRLNAAWHAEALRIRNMSLHWRLKNWQPDLDIPDELEDEMVSTRANQVTVPIKYIVKDDPIALAEVTATVREMYADEIVQKAQSFEARFLEAIIALTETNRFSVLDFLHETDMKEHGHTKYIRYPDLAKVVNFLLDEMNSGISKDVETITMKPAQEKDEEEEDKGKGKGKGKKKKEGSGVSTTTVGDHMRKFQIPVRRLGAGYVVVVWSQSHPEECQNRIDKLKKRFGLEFLNDGEDILEPVKMSATAEMVPDEPPFDEQMDLYAEMAENDE
jgi:hypothetical protein